MKLTNFLFRHARLIAAACCAISFFGVVVSAQGLAQAAAAQNTGTAAQNSKPIQIPPPQAAQSSPATSRNSLEAEFPNGEGKQAFLTTCSKCHSPERVIGRGQDANGWTNVVLQMIQNGAQGTTGQFAAIVDYLSHHFGPPPSTVNVNAATAMDFRNWLFFTKKQADAVVAYRKQHGDFKSIADLEKVPGIDPKMIEGDKAQLTFPPSSPARPAQKQN